MPGSSSDKVGRYQLVRKIATGGMAELYLAKVAGPAGFEKPVVIKRILPHLADDPQFVSMFLDEARVAAMLSHPHIAQIYDFGQEDGTFYLAMEVVNGPDLRRLVNALTKIRMRLPPEICARILAQAADALDYAHNAIDGDGNPLNIIHRDVSPQNIIVSFDGAVKLVDFGVAKAAGRAHRTEAGSVKGKFAYMAPEQLDNRPLDKRCDIFGLGLVLYEIACGMPAYRGDSDIAVVKAAADARFIPPKEVRPDLPDDLVAIMTKALQKDRERRYQTARDMQKALDAWLFRSGSPVPPHEIADFLKQVSLDSGDPLTFSGAGSRPSQVRKRTPQPAPLPTHTAPDFPLEPDRIDSGEVVELSTSDLQAPEMSLAGPEFFGEPDHSLFGEADLSQLGEEGEGPTPGVPQAPVTKILGRRDERPPSGPQRVNGGGRPHVAMSTEDVPTMQHAVSSDVETAIKSMDVDRLPADAPRLTPDDILSEGPLDQPLDEPQTGEIPLFDLQNGGATVTRPSGRVGEPFEDFVAKKPRRWLLPTVGLGILAGASAALGFWYLGSQAEGNPAGIGEVRTAGDKSVKAEPPKPDPVKPVVAKAEPKTNPPKPPPKPEPAKPEPTRPEVAAKPPEPAKPAETGAVEVKPPEAKPPETKPPEVKTAEVKPEPKGVEAKPPGIAAPAKGDRVRPHDKKETKVASAAAAERPDPVEADPRPIPPPPPPPPPEKTEPAGRPGEGFLTIGSTPWTEVFLDGHNVGGTPLRHFAVPAGKHEIRLVNREKNIEKSLSVSVPSGGEEKQNVKIAKGRVSFRVKPWADVSMENRQLGTTPLPDMELYEGQYTFTFVNKDLGRKETRTVEVRGDSDQVVKVDLSR